MSLHGAEGETGAERLDFALDVAQASGHYNPYPGHNSGHLHHTPAGLPFIGGGDTAHARDFERTPVARDMADRVGGIEAFDVHDRLTMDVRDVQRQFDMDSATARLEQRFENPGIRHLLEDNTFGQELQSLSDDISETGFHLMPVSPLSDDMSPAHRAMTVADDITKHGSRLARDGQDVDVGKVEASARDANMIYARSEAFREEMEAFREDRIQRDAEAEVSIGVD